MGVLANLIAGSQPAYFGGGMRGGGTEGATWRWSFTVSDNGAAVNLTGVTTVCHIVDTSGLLVVAATCTGSSLGVLTMEVDESATGSLAAGARASGRACKWWATCSDGTDVWQLWGAANSSFTIYPKAV